MGTQGSKSEKKRMKKIEKSLEETKNKLAKEIRLLLLGTGDSGKSTFVKQFQILYQDGFSKDKIHSYKPVIRCVVKYSLKQLIEANKKLETELKKKNQKIAEDYLKKFAPRNFSISTKQLIVIQQIWSDPAIKNVWDLRDNFQIPDNSDYFLDNAGRIFDKSYSPNNIDILNCRIATTGIQEIHFDVGEKNWVVVDVGGQRNERRKWIHHFEGVHALIFVIGINEFAKKLYEDNTINRMHESLMVWESTLKNRYFKKTPIILMFNKVDLFKESLIRSNLSDCFPDFNGENNFEEASKFIKKKFIKKKYLKFRKIYHHFTCGTDTKMVGNIFSDVMETILDNHLKDYFV
ncbi:guanine nucleotide-binding protein g(o) subunit alpha [Anaeramoeba flamelloides]|uniref:Guanine nucleotide-binding protein g(O) subunit alpha n=1 Tax=Anaeramoeba flamelloides TaxID=1746091 RepID=A0AAV7YQH0_9EUKA|nr:guanine nucleotide-binding protein g(o) subunit alpha [Anaeramoeba flamelloides]